MSPADRRPLRVSLFALYSSLETGRRAMAAAWNLSTSRGTSTHEEPAGCQGRDDQQGDGDFHRRHSGSREPGSGSRVPRPAGGAGGSSVGTIIMGAVLTRGKGQY